MAWSANEVYLPGMTAENDLSAKQCYVVELGGAAGQVDITDGATDLVVGVLCNKPTAGEEALVQCGGVAKVIAGGSVSRGNRVGCDNAGKAVAKTADADLTFGIALEDADTSDIFPVLLCIGTQRAS